MMTKLEDGTWMCSYKLYLILNMCFPSAIILSRMMWYSCHALEHGEKLSYVATQRMTSSKDAEARNQKR